MSTYQRLYWAEREELGPGWRGNTRYGPLRIDWSGMFRRSRVKYGAMRPVRAGTERESPSARPGTVAGLG